jgi:hypothetical protein
MHDFIAILHQPGVNWFSLVALPLMIVVPTVTALMWAEREQEK